MSIWTKSRGNNILKIWILNIFLLSPDLFLKCLRLEIYNCIIEWDHVVCNSKQCIRLRAQTLEAPWLLHDKVDWLGRLSSWSKFVVNHCHNFDLKYENPHAVVWQGEGGQKLVKVKVQNVRTKGGQELDGSSGSEMLPWRIRSSQEGKISR